MRPNFYKAVLAVILFSTSFIIESRAGQVFGTVIGESVVYNLPFRAHGEFVITKKCLSGVAILQYIEYQIYCAPDGVDIVSQTVCLINGQTVITLMLSNGQTVIYDQFTGTVIQSNNIPDLGLQAPLEITGDALYVRSYNYVSKSVDHGQSWVVDTLGLNGAYLYSICTDTAQNVYVAANNGLYGQTANGNSWTRNTNFPANNCDLVFVDRQNRLFAATLSMLYSSTNSGLSFQPDTAGIGHVRVNSIGDDAFGNIYLIVSSTGLYNGDRIYRSLGGTQPFERIDQPLTALNFDSYTVPFMQVSGDTVLFAATAYGSFYSLDSGTTWTVANRGISAESFFGLAQANNGNMITTTHLGCFSSTNAADTAWNQVYPQNGYAGGQPLFKDNTGALYTEGGTLLTDFNSQTRMVVRSTDNGVSWQPDTLGISQIHMFKWFVDETGTQHGAQFGNGVGPIGLFSKPVGQAWAIDTTGFHSGNSDQPTAFGTNGNGKIYFSNTTQSAFTPLWSKQGAGNWALDTIGLNDEAYDFAHTSSNTMYLGAYTGVWKQTGNSWVKLPNPNGSTLSAFAVAVDASNTLWAAFSYFDAYYNSIGLGVYYTNNDGATWLTPSFDIDTVTFLKLVAIGDSVYGLSYYNGAYLFDKSFATEAGPVLKQQNGIHVFPNPGYNYFIFQFDVNEEENATLEIFNSLGQKVGAATNTKCVKGTNEIRFDNKQLATGSYFYHLTTSCTMYSGKLVVVH